jgi:hypothetical protein
MPGRILATVFFLLSGFVAFPQSYEEADIDTTIESTGPYFRNLAVDDTVTLQYRKLPDNYIDKLKKDKDFWYVEGTETPKTKDPQPTNKKPPREAKRYTPVSEKKWFQTLLWVIIIVGFGAALIWYLAGSNVGLFRKKAAPVTNPEGEEELSTDIFAINYQREIDRAASQGNYRLAVRLMFLRTLRHLTDRGIIRYTPDRTNFEYLSQLQPTGYYRPFFRLAQHYEYSWYGHFEVGDHAYGIIRNEFEQFDRQIT